MCIKPFFSKVRYLFIPLLMLFFSACFSPWQGGEGTLTLHLGGSSGRAMVLPEEQSSLNYTITLTGSGQSITKTFPAGAVTATFSVQPGTWNVMVKGRGARPQQYETFPDYMLCAYGEKTVTIKGGGSTSESIEMYSAVEAENDTQLQIAFDRVNINGNKEYVFVTKNIYLLNPAAYEINRGRNIELRAEKRVTIERADKNKANIPLFSILEGGTLTLGKEGETNQYLYISGEIGGKDQNDVTSTDNVPYATAPLVQVGNANTGSGTLIMYDARIFHNRVNEAFEGRAPGVHVIGENTKFTMYGGSIDGNSGNSMGGGVVVDNGGTFTLNGGTIEGNQAINGGGVGVYNGIFIMNGGYIKVNKTGINSNNGNGGGGVSVDNGGIFTLNGGTIEGNWAADRGGGVSVDSGGTFTLNGGYIEGNKVITYGGQVYVGGIAAANAGRFYMTAGTLSGKGSADETQANLGAGVFIESMGIFTKTGGIIYAGGSDRNNLHAYNDAGNAVYNDINNAARKRNTTLWDDDDISTESNENWDL